MRRFGFFPIIQNDIAAIISQNARKARRFMASGGDKWLADWKRAARQFDGWRSKITTEKMSLILSLPHPFCCSQMLL
jgi:hypothetical protein